MSYIFLILASICNACMDTLSFHFFNSVFCSLNPNFWNPNYSWAFEKLIPFTKYRVDAWHLFKSAMIVFFCLAIVFFNGKLWEFIILGCVWNLTFNIFYEKILKQ